MGLTKHYFIINPKAGKFDISEKLRERIDNLFKDIDEDYTIYITKGIGDAEDYCKNICQNETGSLRFYAAGGDGTLNEVVNGIKGCDNASVGVLPYGTGNDFIKNFEKVDFLNLDGQVVGKSEKIDLLRVKDKGCINICNIGFDAKVASQVNKFKKLPFMNGATAYTLALFYSLLNRMHENFEITLDNNEVIKGNFLLCTFSNGVSYGGGYKAAPLAKINDGLFDVCLVKKVSRFKLVKLLGAYKNGEHLDNDEISKYIIYRKCKEVTVTSNNKFYISVDGEIFEDNKLKVSIEEEAINFLVPKVIEEEVIQEKMRIPSVSAN
ncbi:MAG: diacylglycerol kinase family lipid kinase [Clostridiales bacterium]|nr:diacylglycerol kinase family lipid kinase [Clostridiales bacterium]